MKKISVPTFAILVSFLIITGESNASRISIEDKQLDNSLETTTTNQLSGTAIQLHQHS
jgi:hypothetical protein